MIIRVTTLEPFGKRDQAFGYGGRPQKTLAMEQNTFVLNQNNVVMKQNKVAMNQNNVAEKHNNVAEKHNKVVLAEKPVEMRSNRLAPAGAE